MEPEIIYPYRLILPPYYTVALVNDIHDANVLFLSIRRSPGLYSRIYGMFPLKSQVFDTFS